MIDTITKTKQEVGPVKSPAKLNIDIMKKVTQKELGLIIYTYNKKVFVVDVPKQVKSQHPTEEDAQMFINGIVDVYNNDLN